MVEAIEEKLTELEEAFVGTYIELGGTDGTKAAIMAGYSKNGASVRAYELLRRPRVLAAIRKEAERRLQAGVALGAAVLVELATAAKSETVRRQAAKDLLDHGGLPAITRSEHHVVVSDRRTDAELRQHVAHLVKELGLTATVISGVAAPSDMTQPVALPHPVVDVIDVEPLPDLFE